MHMKLGFSLTALAGSTALLIGTLAACSTPPKPLYSQEQFATGTSPFAHDFKGTPAQTCEAARRALLSQGYITTSTRFDAIDGSKNFQPDNDSHVVIEFHVVCAPGDVSEHSTVYVNALQDRYVLKKSSTNASVGLSVFGSLSLPIGSSDDAMVKVASETIPAGLFYERYFGLLTYYLNSAPDMANPTAATPKPPVPPLPPVKAPEPAHAQAAQVAPAVVTPPMPLPPVAIPAIPAAAAAAPVAASAVFTPDHVFVVPPVTTVGHGSAGTDAAAAQSASSTAAPHAAGPVTASAPAAASAPTAASASGAAPAGASAPAAASAPTGASAPAAAVPVPAVGASATTATNSAVGSSATTAAASASTASAPSVTTSAPNQASAPATTASAISGASVPAAPASLAATSAPSTTTGPSDVTASATTSALATTTAELIQPVAQSAAQPTDAAPDPSSAPAK